MKAGCWLASDSPDACVSRMDILTLLHPYLLLPVTRNKYSCPLPKDCGLSEASLLLSSVCGWVKLCFFSANCFLLLAKEIDWYQLSFSEPPCTLRQNWDISTGLRLCICKSGLWLTRVTPWKVSQFVHLSPESFSSIFDIISSCFLSCSL